MKENKKTQKMPALPQGLSNDQRKVIEKVRNGMQSQLPGFQILSYTFEGEYTDTSSIRNDSGVYFIFSYPSATYYDIGESENLKDALENPELQKLWREKTNECKDEIYYGVFYTDKVNRIRIYNELNAVLFKKTRLTINN